MRVGLAIFLVWLLPASALAVDKGEAELSGGVGLALAFQGQTRAGAQGELRLLRGLSDAWAARLGLQTAWYPAHGTTPSAHVTAQALGLTWSADVLNLVPFADLGIVVGDIRGGGMAASQRLGGQFGVGADYLLSRHLTMSLLTRVDYLALRLAGGRDNAPTQLTFALNLGRAF
jgi:hypothetical protein